MNCSYTPFWATHVRHGPLKSCSVKRLLNSHHVKHAGGRQNCYVINKHSIIFKVEMGTSYGENTALITRFHNNHLFSIIQTKLIQAKISKSKVGPKKFAQSGFAMVAAKLNLGCYQSSKHFSNRSLHTIIWLCIFSQSPVLLFRDV